MRADASTTGTLLRSAARPLECRLCGIAYGSGYQPTCERCGGPTDVFYDLGRVRIDAEGNPLQRYRDLLPVADPAALVWAGEGDTPLVHATEIGAAVGLNRLYLKVEGANPTGSTKDRMASVALAFLQERGVREFTISSTGNSSTSFGTMAPAFPDLRLHIFCGRDFLDRLNFAPAANVEIHAVDGSFVEAGKAAAAFATANGLTFERGFFNPARREGLKLAYLEAFDQMPVEPVVVVQAISSGMGIYGAHKGIIEYRTLGRLSRVPRIVCAQQARCAPMYRGWREGVESLGPRHVVRRPDGLAKAILRGDASATYPYMHRIVVSSGGRFEAVEDDAIIAARRLANDLEGLDICYASAVALGATLNLARSGWIRPDECVLVNLTGRDRAAGTGPERRPPC